MNKTSIRTLLLITILFAFTMADPTRIGCVARIGRDQCTLCAGRRMHPMNDGTGNVYCSTQYLLYQHACLITSTFSNNGCWWCREGYARKIDDYDNLYCAPTTIMGCAHAIVDKNGVHRCQACVTGYPNEDNTVCVPFQNDEGFKYQCSYGARNYFSDKKEPYCWKCNENFLSVAGICRGVESWPALEGCQISADESSCAMCDFNRAFRISEDDFSCTYQRVDALEKKYAENPSDSLKKTIDMLKGFF